MKTFKVMMTVTVDDEQVISQRGHYAVTESAMLRDIKRVITHYARAINKVESIDVIEQKVSHAKH